MFTSCTRTIFKCPLQHEKNVNVGFKGVILVSALFTGAHRFTIINIIWKKTLSTYRIFIAHNSNFEHIAL